MNRALVLIPKCHLWLAASRPNCREKLLRHSSCLPVTPRPHISSRFSRSFRVSPPVAMAEESKLADADQGAGGKNAAAERDVQDVLAELKRGDAGEQVQESAATNGGEEKDKDKTEEAKEEEKVIAAANKLGEKAVSEDRSRSHPGRGQREQTHRVNYKDNIKSDLTTGETSSDPDEIRKQVEFYFSDSNLPMDKFLLSKVGGSENRPVDINAIHAFKRMRRFQPLSAVVDALRESKTLELTDNDTHIRRKEALPENVNENLDPNVVKVFEDQAMQRSIYAKGFGEELPSTQFDIEAFFTPYGPLNAVRLRRTREKLFKGSVFVEFDSEETQKKFLELDPKPKWNGTTDLLIKSKKDYCEDKVKEIQAGRIKANNKFGNRGRGRGRGRDRGRDERDWRDRREEDQKKGFKPNRGGHRGGRNDRSKEKPDRQAQKEEATGSEVDAKGDQSAAVSGQKRARVDDAPGENNNNGDVDTDRPAKKVDAGEG